jgi:hypothetical protein
MQTLMQKSARAIVVAFGMLALAVGSAQALEGSGASTLACDGESQVGSCLSNQQCQGMCDLVYGEGVRGGSCSPITNCCTCFVLP